MQIKYKVGIIKKSRYLDGTWNFQYVTQNMDGQDQTVYGGVEDQDKSHYPYIQHMTFYKWLSIPSSDISLFV